MNHVAQDVVPAFLDLPLEDQAERAEHLDLVEVAEEGVWSVAEDGTPDPDHSDWPALPGRTALGLRLEAGSTG